MLYLKIKNKKLRHHYKKIEKYRLLGKFLESYFGSNIKLQKYNYLLKSIKLLKKHYLNNSSRIRLKSRCIFTNRSRSINKKYNISRFIYRDFINFGLISGYKKAVW